VPDLDFISSELRSDTPDQLNYRIRVGSRELQSSTIWIRDDDGTPIGAICINLDYFELNQAYNILGRLTQSARKPPELTVQDTWAKDMDDLINLSISAYLRDNKIASVEKMTQDDRLQLIATFEESGLFNLRGAASHLAGILNVSRASIYTCMGSDSEDKQELFSDVFSKADIVTCDKKSQVFRLGELHHAKEAGLITEDQVLELGQLTSGQKLGRESEKAITVCDLTGVGIQDTQISRLDYHKAIDRGFGLSIE
jgi:predicted transcriptional regulator YheO